MTKRVQRLGINVELNKEASSEDIQNFGADYTIIATGAGMEPHPFNGASEDKVLTAIQAFNGMEPKGDRVLVMGGGIMGTEVALYLSNQGKQVTITTRREAEELARELFDHNNRDTLLRLVKSSGIKVLSGTVPVKLEDECAVLDQNGVETKLPIDSLVYAGRLVPNNELYESVKDMDNVFNLGDSAEPGRIMDAVWGGFETVREIESR